MTHSVNQARAVARFLTDNLSEKIGNLSLIGYIADAVFDKADHLRNLDVCSAVLGSFKRADACRH